jgi:hypothetical protein
VEDSLDMEDLDYAVFSNVSPRSDEVIKGAEITTGNSVTPLLPWAAAVPWIVQKVSAS